MINPTDPTEVTLREYGFILGVALLGGIVSWFAKVRQGTANPWNVLQFVGELATSAELDSGQRSAVFDLSAALQAARAGATEIAVVECARDVASLLEDPAQRMRLMLVAGRASVDCFGLDANADAAYFDAAHEAIVEPPAALAG